MSRRSIVQVTKGLFYEAFSAGSHERRYSASLKAALVSHDDFAQRGNALAADALGGAADCHPFLPRLPVPGDNDAE